MIAYRGVFVWSSSKSSPSNVSKLASRMRSPMALGRRLRHARYAMAGQMPIRSQAPTTLFAESGCSA